VKRQLKELAMVDVAALPKDKVALGSRVSLYDGEGDRTIVYELVLPDMADFAKGFVSVTSPIGKGLLGHRVGDEITIKIPAGTRNYEIVKLETLHDRAPK
jgi:transcription elongation factor GreA